MSNKMPKLSLLHLQIVVIDEAVGGGLSLPARREERFPVILIPFTPKTRIGISVKDFSQSLVRLIGPSCLLRPHAPYGYDTTI